MNQGLPALRHSFAALIATALVAACGTAPQPLTAEPSSAVTIMSFNVENLFDNADDPHKTDETFLSIEDKQSREHIAGCLQIPVERWRDQCLHWDWSDRMIETKLEVLAAAILQVGNGRGPDIIALQEVENTAIVERLRNEHLAAAGYRPTILIEGDDARGIDVAFLSRLPLQGSPRLTSIPFVDVAPDRVADTRGILEATFVLPNDDLLTGFAVHFPAPFHPTAMREFAYRHLNALLDALPADRPAFAAGDFNTTLSEDRERRLLDRFVRPAWQVAHDLPCGSFAGACRGSSYYPPNDEWSFLDMILWSPGRTAGHESGKKATWSIRANSVRIANRTAAQRQADGTPARFEMPAGRGVSDHWPMVMTIETK